MIGCATSATASWSAPSTSPIPCLLLYPLNEWEEVERKLKTLSSTNPAERRLQRLLLGHAAECELDGNGRLLLSQPLRSHAGLDKKVMLVGQLNKFELWDEARWQQQINDDILGLPGTTGQVHHDYRIFFIK